MKQDQKKYDTSQDIFYKVCETGWNLCRHHLADFAQLKALYTPAYTSNAMKMLKAAEKLPANSQTLKNTKEIRMNMIKAARPALDYWQALKLHIIQAYPNDMVDNYLKMAGSDLYKKAAAHNWNSMSSLMDDAQVYMAQEFDTLTANKNMPHNFPEKFKQAAETFFQIENVFFDAKIRKSGITYSKLQANNKVYDTLISMMKDAQHIFRHRPEIKKQFIFSNLVSAYENKNAAGKKASGTRQLQHSVISAADVIKGNAGSVEIMQNVA